MTTKKIALLAFEGIELLDLSGPQSAFHEANSIASDAYELIVVGFNRDMVTSEAGTQIIPNMALSDLTDCHTLIIPGGKGARLRDFGEHAMGELAKVVANAERVVTVCTGTFLLAKVGIPDGTKVATHWHSLDTFQSLYPELKVDRDKLYINDGKYWTSAGVTSGIDLSLRLIELDLGSEVASQVARLLVVYLKRSGSQQQFSEFLNLQSPKSNKVASLIAWLQEHLSKAISVPDMAQQVNMSERQLHRLFVQETGTTPAAYLETIRMDTARTLLSTSASDIKRIAYSVGFQSYDGFKRAFERAYGTTPSQFRSRFHSAG